MRRASSRPQQLKEQLLQAIDDQNNIQNMMAVLDVICCLERCPMTKEALVETRLGKLINDVRKRSTDKDLVKRLKSLVRDWQRLVGANEAVSTGFSSSDDSVPAGSAQTLTENHSRTLLHNNMSQKDEMHVPGKTIKYPSSFRKSKIPVLAIRPYSSCIKHLHQFKSFRPSQSNQHFQEQHKLQSDTKHLMEAEEPAQSTCVTSTLPLNSSIKDSYINMHQPSDLLNTLTKNHSSGGPAEDRTRTTQQQTGKLQYDPHTQEIKPVSSKTSNRPRSSGSEIQGPECLKQNLCSIQQTNWSETSQCKIQNSSLTSGRSGLDFSVAEKFKHETNVKVCRVAHAFIPSFPVTDLPGVGREVTERDLVRIRSHRWHGVNGCYDNRNNWYDWTQSITLDPHGDGRKLKISPYVAIDYKL